MNPNETPGQTPVQQYYWPQQYPLQPKARKVTGPIIALYIVAGVSTLWAVLLVGNAGPWADRVAIAVYVLVAVVAVTAALVAHSAHLDRVTHPA